MAKKDPLICSSCYRTISGDHFSVAAGAQTMHFHKDAHACASAPDRNPQKKFGPELKKEVERGTLL